MINKDDEAIAIATATIEKDWVKCRERELKLFESLDAIGQAFRNAYGIQKHSQDQFLKLFGEATDKLDNLTKLCKAFLDKQEEREIKLNSN